jgi:hypothetical protein
MVIPSDLVLAKPKDAHVFRQEAPRCDYDHAMQVRRWAQSERMRRVLLTTGAPTSSTTFDGEGDE